jgi:hypothetical protein
MHSANMKIFNLLIVLFRLFQINLNKIAYFHTVSLHQNTILFFEYTYIKCYAPTSERDWWLDAVVSFKTPNSASD